MICLCPGRKRGYCYTKIYFFNIPCKRLLTNEIRNFENDLDLKLRLLLSVVRFAERFYD